MQRDAMPIIHHLPQAVSEGQVQWLPQETTPQPIFSAEHDIILILPS